MNRLRYDSDLDRRISEAVRLSLQFDMGFSTGRVHRMAEEELWRKGDFKTEVPRERSPQHYLAKHLQRRWDRGER